MKNSSGSSIVRGGKDDKITFDQALKLNPKLNPQLFMPDPHQVPAQMNRSPIKDWLEYIEKEYELTDSRNLILIPCSFYKPYDPPHDEFYKRIEKVKSIAKDSYFMTISVPLGLEPQEFWSFEWKGFNMVYDCPFFPWIERFGYSWNAKIAEQVFTRLREVIEGFFRRNESKYERAIAFFVPSSDELMLVRRYVDAVVPRKEPNIEVSYNNNTSEIYCNSEVWKEFEHLLKARKII